MTDTENLKKIESDLGANYRNDEDVLKDILEEVSSLIFQIEKQMMKSYFHT